MSGIGFVDTYLALIIPAIGSSLGLFLMKQFMVTVHDSILEAAKIDGAGEDVYKRQGFQTAFHRSPGWDGS